jgi:hypothetical protein
VKIRKVVANNRKRAFEVHTPRGVYDFPYARADPMPSPEDRLRRVYVDDEIGREGFTWVLESGAEGSLHVDSVLDVNCDPTYMVDLLLHNLTVEALDLLEESGLGKRAIARRLGTSASQLYRLLDPTNKRKSLRHMVELLYVLGAEVRVEVTRREPAGAALSAHGPGPGRG